MIPLILLYTQGIQQTVAGEDWNQHIQLEDDSSSQTLSNCEDESVVLAETLNYKLFYKNHNNNIKNLVSIQSGFYASEIHTITKGYSNVIAIANDFKNILHSTVDNFIHSATIAMLDYIRHIDSLESNYMLEETLIMSDITYSVLITQALDFFVAQGADINAKNKYGETILYQFANKQSHNEVNTHINSIPVIIDHIVSNLGADIYGNTDEDFSTPLATAIGNNRVDNVKTLLALNAMSRNPFAAKSMVQDSFYRIESFYAGTPSLSHELRKVEEIARMIHCEYNRISIANPL